MSLAFYLNNHGVPEYVYSDPIDIQTWLDSIPTPETFEFLMYAIPISEQGNIFRIRDVSEWYGLFCDKIAANLDIEVLSLGSTTQERKDKIKQYTGVFIKLLIAMNLLNVDMQALINNLINRSQEGLQILLLFFVADGIIVESTLFKLQPELSLYKRWQSIGLPALPTIEEINEAL